MKHLATPILASLALATVSHAATIVNVTGITGHDGGNWPSSLGHLTDMVNATNIGWATGDHNPGIDTSADANDPSTWINNSGTWQSEWLANSRLDTGTSLNNKMGWVVMNFGSAVANLENMYVWNGRYSGANEETRSFNVYYSSGVGIDGLPAMPNSKSSTGDYDFSSGDWTQLGSTVSIGGPGSPYTPDQTIALGSITAQYIGIEILTAEGAASRVGLGQIEFTAVPESSAALLGGLGALMLLRRRR